MASSPGYALAQLWPSLTAGTTAAKVAQVNAMTVAGPNVDVGIPQVAGYLLLQGIYPTVQTFATSNYSTNGSDPVHDRALTALKTFVAWISIPNAPPVHFSDPTVYALITAFAGAVAAQETATPGSTGFTQAVHDGLLALGQTTQPWWQANGFFAPVTLADAINNGLS
jgi:hypothetical protein